MTSELNFRKFQPRFFFDINLQDSAENSGTLKSSTSKVNFSANRGHLQNTKARNGESVEILKNLEA